MVRVMRGSHRKIASVAKEIGSPLEKNSGGGDRVTRAVPMADLVSGRLAKALRFFERLRKGKTDDVPGGRKRALGLRQARQQSFPPLGQGFPRGRHWPGGL